MARSDGHEAVAQRVSHLLRRAIEHAGISVNELSKRKLGAHSGSGERQLHRYIKGENIPRIDILNELVSLCGMDLVVAIRPRDPEEDDEEG